MKPGARIAFVAGALVAAAALAWWRWGEASFVAGFGAMIC